MAGRFYNGLIINFYYHYPDTLYEPTFVDFYFNGHFYLKYERYIFNNFEKILHENWHYNYPEDYEDTTKSPLFICSCGMVNCSFSNVNVKHNKDLLFFYDFICVPNYEDEDEEKNNCNGKLIIGKDFIITKKELELSMLMAYSFLAATSITGEHFIKNYNLMEKFENFLNKDFNWLLERGYLFIIYYQALETTFKFEKEKALTDIDSFHCFFHRFKKKYNKEIIDFLIEEALNNKNKVTKGHYALKTSYTSYFATQILFAFNENISQKVWKEIYKNSDCEIKQIAEMALKGKWIKKFLY